MTERKSEKRAGVRESKKPDRFERMVAKVKTKFQCVTSDVQYHLIPDTVVVALLRQEHQAVGRMVKEPLKYLRSKANQDYQNGYIDAVMHILSQLNKRSHMTDWIPHERSTWPWRIGRLRIDAGPLPKGTLVKIVMVSRFGDVGITDDLGVEFGHKARVDLDDLCKEETIGGRHDGMGDNKADETGMVLV